VGLDGAAAPPFPVLDRTLVADPDDLLGKTLAGMSRLSPPPVQETEKTTPVITSFPLMQDLID
jgi:hypothetical protein